nr:3'-5' exonuclease [Luteimonas sp. MHLX1A]
MNGSLSQRLRALAASKKKTGGSDSVSLLTMHASKGLEFERVWIVGVEDGVLPSTRDGSDIDEERRLLYVGITRAMTDVTLSYSLERGPSRFLKEARLIGSDLLATNIPGI